MLKYANYYDIINENKIRFFTKIRNLKKWEKDLRTKETAKIL